MLFICLSLSCNSSVNREPSLCVSSLPADNVYRFLCGFLPCPPGSYRNHDCDLQHRSMYKPWPSPVFRNCFHSGPCCPGSNHCSSYLVSNSAEKNSETMGSYLQFSLARNCMREWVAQNICSQLSLGMDRGGASTPPIIMPPLLQKTSDSLTSPPSSGHTALQNPPLNRGYEWHPICAEKFLSFSKVLQTCGCLQVW